MRAGVSIIRVSGPKAAQALQALAPHAKPPPPRTAVVRKLTAPSTRDLLDEALVLYMPGPKTFTGEDTLELHTHGSRAVVSATLHELGALDGLRLAEPGEFTRQAYANGRMELTQVEGLGDLINADTEQQRRQALAALGGAQRRAYDGWRQALLKSLAYTEALIDFGEDEEDVTAAALAGAVDATRAVRAEMEASLTDARRGEAVRDGVRVAILGPPNAGKSSLLNLLSQRDAAIVSPIAGTTRDVVQVTLELGGLPVVLSDTAGLREGSDDPIEVQGMRRSAGEARKAHLQLWVYDATEPPADLSELDAGWAGRGDDADTADGDDDAALPASRRLLVLNKVDLVGGGGDAAAAAAQLAPHEHQWRLSCETGVGVGPFVEALGGIVRELYGADGREPALVTRARHRQHLERCVGALGAFERLAAMGESAPLDLACEELRCASSELGRITGRVDVEDLLDIILRDFCIGK